MQAHVCLPVCGTPWWVLLQHYYVASIFHCRPKLSVYLKFGHHPHPTGYLCAKYCFFRGRYCWASPWRKKARTQSIIQSFTQLIWFPGNRSLRFWINTKQASDGLWGSAAHFIRRVILTRKVDQTDQGSLVGQCLQKYKSLCSDYNLCHPG